MTSCYKLWAHGLKYFYMYRFNKSKINQLVSRVQVSTSVNVHIAVLDSSVSEGHTDSVLRKEAKVEELVFGC